jgi:hypothetical protein
MKGTLVTGIVKPSDLAHGITEAVKPEEIVRSGPKLFVHIEY